MCAKDISTLLDKDPPDRFYADLVLRYAGDGVVISGPDRGALWVNPAFTAQTGYTIDDLAGKDPGDVLQGPDTDRETSRRIKLACGQRRDVRVDILNYSADGRPFWVDLKVTPIFDGQGRHTHFISTLRDITERKSLEQQNEEMRHTEELRQSERQLLALTSEWLYSAKSQDELLMVVQRAMHTLIPEADGALYIYDSDRTRLDLAAQWGTIPEFAAQILPDECWALRRGRAYAYGLKPIQFVCDHVTKPGTPYFCLPIIAHGETIGLMHIIFDGFEEGGVMRHMRDEVLRNRWDISLICAEQISLAVANVRLRQELHERSIRDPLTGLWNRRWFMEQALREMSSAQRDGQQVSLVMVDVDHFKQFNDRFGHDAGDLVLKAVARVLMEMTSDGVMPCRLGGEEFVLLCPNTLADQAAAHAEHLRAALSAVRLTHAGIDLPPVTASCGVAASPAHGMRVEDVLAVADRALYQAKAAGRDRTIIAPDTNSG
jgi:diguanylate cyclase (GGDEF)-like protein/PAS domain S-box-containing protein